MEKESHCKVSEVAEDPSPAENIGKKRRTTTRRRGYIPKKRYKQNIRNNFSKQSIENLLQISFFPVLFYFPINNM